MSETNPVEEALASGDAEHQRAAAELPGDITAKTMAIISSSIHLALFVITANDTPWDRTFANDLAARAGLARALRSIRAAVHLVWTGYPEEAAALLRLAYEAAGLARVLAKDVEGANDWLVKGHSWPDSRVRRWIRENRDKAAAGDLDAAYSLLSAYAHPSARSCMAQIDIEPTGPQARLSTRFSEDAFRSQLWYVAATAIFVVFCARNAAAGPSGDSLPSWWHEAAANLMETYVEWANLDMNVEHVREHATRHAERWSSLKEEMADLEDLEAALDEDPDSWRNVQRLLPAPTQDDEK